MQAAAHALAGKTITTTKPLHPPARILTGLTEGIHMPSDMQYQRKVIVGGQHKAAADYVHPHLNTDSLE